MALREMKTTRAAVSADPVVLYNSEYVGDAITLDAASFTEGVCKAGTPIGLGGVVANDATALGVLLHDVYEERPQGTIVIGGYIHTERAQQNSGVTIADAAKNAMKNVVFC